MASTWTRRTRRAGALLLALAVATMLAACSGDFKIRSGMPPDAASVQGRAISDVYNIVFVIGAAIFVFVEGLILIAVVRYRRRKGQTDLPPQIHGNMTLEVVWTAIPIAIVTFLFFLSWQTLNTVGAKAAQQPLRIGVVAFQWQWQFVYAPPEIRWEDCGAAANKGRCVTIVGVAPAPGQRDKWQPPQLHVPLGQAVELQMHAVDVIHSFYVPAFLFQRDITPAADQVIEFTADRVGTFRGQCTQFCGLKHGEMEFEVVVQEPADYTRWLQAALTPTPSPSAGPPSSAGPGGSPSGSAPPASAPPASAPPASAPPGGSILKISAQGTAFDTDTLEAPAGTPFSIEFANNDAGIPHNVAIRDASGATVFSGDIFSGLETRTYQVPALPAGTYTFFCTVHTNMTGTLTVK